MTAVAKDADEVALPPLPAALGCESWRLQANAAIMAAPS